MCLLTKGREGDGPIRLFGDEAKQGAEESERIVARSYSRWIQLTGAALATAVGLVWLMGSF